MVIIVRSGVMIRIANIWFIYSYIEIAVVNFIF